MKNGNFDDPDKIYIKKVPIEMKDCVRVFWWIMLVFLDVFILLDFERLASWFYNWG
jgi:hypothetical protein